MLGSLVRTLAFVALPQSAAATPQEEAARLVPADATVLVRFESLDALLGLIRSFGPIAGEPVASLDAAMLLGGMGLAGDSRAIDPKLPLHFALSIDPAAGAPRTTWVVPVRDAAAFQRPLVGRKGPQKVVALGTHVGVSTHPSFAASHKPNPLVARLRPGVASVHLDLSKLIALYRPLIDMGLESAESQVDSLAAQPGLPSQMGPLVEVYLGAARAIVDSAEALDFALRMEAGRLAFRADLVARAGSELDGWVLETGGEMGSLAGLIDPTSSMQVLSNVSLRSVLQRFGPMIDLALEVYPEPLRAELERLLETQAKVALLLEPGLAAGFEFSDEGLRGSYLLRSTRPGEVIASIERLLTSLSQEGRLVRFTTLERLNEGGIEGRAWQMTIDHEALLTLMQAQTGQGGREGAAAQDLEQLRAMMQAMYGRDLRVVLAQHADRVALLVGADDEYLRASLRRLKTPVAPPAGLVQSLRAIETGSAGIVYRVDFARLMAGMFGAMGTVVPLPLASLPDRPFALDFWGSVRGRTWSGGVTTSLDELLGFVRTMRGP